MSTPAAPIVEFLLARIAEDEACARRAIVLPVTQHMEPGSWRTPASGVIQTDDDLVPAGDSRVAAHMARFNPARVLIECHAKRAIIRAAWPLKYFDAAHDILHSLASAYADHPDFDPAWRV